MQIVSLFFWCRRIRFRFINADHEIIWANDNDKNSCETYRLNIGNHIVHKDIQDINNSDIPNCDAIIGGFPCQGFSLANRQRKPDDERNVLYKFFKRIVEEKKASLLYSGKRKGHFKSR